MRQTNDVVQWWSPKAAAAWQELAARIDELEQAEAARERGAQRYLAALMAALREGRPAPSMEEFEAFGRGGGYSGNDLYDDLDSGSATVTNPSSTQASDHPDLPATNDRPQAGETSGGPPSVYAPLPGSTDYTRASQEGDASGLGVTPGSAVSSGVGTDSTSRATAPATPWPDASQGATSGDEGARQGSGPSPASVPIDTLLAADAEQAWATAAAGQPVSATQAPATPGGWSYDANTNAADLAAHLQQHPLRPGRQDLSDFQHREQTGEPPGSTEDDLRRVGPLGRIGYHTAEAFAQPVATAVDERATPLQRALATLQAAGTVLAPEAALESAVAGAGTWEVTGSPTLGTIASLAAPLASPALLRGGAALAGTLGQQIEEAGGLLPLLERAEMRLPGDEELPIDPAGNAHPLAVLKALVSAPRIPGTPARVIDTSGTVPADVQRMLANASYAPDLVGDLAAATEQARGVLNDNLGLNIAPPDRVNLSPDPGAYGSHLTVGETSSPALIQYNPWLIAAEGSSLADSPGEAARAAAKQATRTITHELLHGLGMRDSPALKRTVYDVMDALRPQLDPVADRLEPTFARLAQNEEWQHHVQQLDATHR